MEDLGILELTFSFQFQHPLWNIEDDYHEPAYAICTKYDI